MPFFLDTRETSQRFGNDIAEFRSLLDTNHIRHGSPDDLFEFTRMLESDNLFRLDLSALVKSIVQKEHSEILLTDMVSIIAASVAGPSFADTRIDLSKPTNTLMEFLLGTGCWRQFGSPSQPVSQTTPPPLRPPVRAEEPRPQRVSPPASSVPAAPVTSGERASLLDASSELRQTLTRLEINTLQVKLHLESIEQRISKIEPAPDAAPPETPSPPEPLLHRAPGKPVPEKFSQLPVEPGPAFAPEPPTYNRAVFSHQPYEPQSLADADDDFSSPTFSFATETGRNIVPIGVLLVVVVIIALVLLFGHSRSGQTYLQSGLGAIHSLFGNSPVPAGAPAATRPPTETHPTASVTPLSGTSTPPADSGIGHSAAPSGASPDTSTDDQNSVNPKLKYVPASVMAGNLLSAPRPEYPPRARAEHIEGQIAMQATISRSGSIRTLHVIKGPASLRSAAIDAVRHWRYKPYTVDGRPMEVATTVYVDFSLKPPPAIAH